MRANHRKYVGGRWEKVGKRQLEFMIEMGLRPSHKFLDIGCGSLRGRRLFINYLNKGNYYGIDRHRWLIDAGVKYELGSKDREKEPNFLVNGGFDFLPFKTKFDFALASSLFTHLTKDKIRQCIANLLPVMYSHGEFYASIFKGKSRKNRTESCDTKKFLYYIEEIRELADDWKMEALNQVPSRTLRGRYYFYQTILKFTKA